MLREKFEPLRKALNEFYPLISGLESTIDVAEAKLSNLQNRKSQMEEDLKRQLLENEAILSKEKEMRAAMMIEAQATLKAASDLYLEARKDKAVQRKFSEEEYQKKLAKLEETSKKVKEVAVA